MKKGTVVLLSVLAVVVLLVVGVVGWGISTNKVGGQAVLGNND